MNESRYIIDGDFATISTDKFLDKGIKYGRLVYVAGHRAIPIEENNPYTQRIKFFVHLLEGDHVKPNLGLFLMDPDSLVKVGKTRQKKLSEIMRLDFETDIGSASN